MPISNSNMEKQVILRVNTEDANVTVRELRNEISKLRDELLNTDKTSSAYGETVRQISEIQTRLSTVMRAEKEQVTDAAGSYNALVQEMAQLKREWRSTGDEATRASLGQRISEVNQQLKDMDASIGNHQRNVGNYKSALEGVNKEYANQRQELRALRNELDNLEEGTEEYNAAFMRAAELTHNLQERQEFLRYASADLGDQITNVIGIAGNVAAGFSAVQAAMGLFGEESDDVAQAMLKVQQAMALVQGLEGLDGFINRTEGLSKALRAMRADTVATTTATEAQAAATKAETTATVAQTTATNAASVAQKGLNAAIKANPVGLFITALVLLIANFEKIVDWVGDMTGGFDNLRKVWDVVIQTASGVGNAILKFVVTPIRTAINTVSMLGSIIGDVFRGDWDKIGEDWQNGLKKIGKDFVDGVNLVGNTVDGYRNTQEKRERKRIQEAAEMRAKEIENIIADNEAKYGSDWQYTEEAIKLQRELNAERLKMYDEDSDEYREAVREQMRYERELTEYQEAQAKARLDEQKAESDARISQKEKEIDQMKVLEAELQNEMKQLERQRESMNQRYDFEISTGNDYDEFINTGHLTPIKDFDEYEMRLNQIDEDFNYTFASLNQQLTFWRNRMRQEGILSDEDVAEAKAKVEEITNDIDELFITRFTNTNAVYMDRYNSMLDQLKSDMDEELSDMDNPEETYNTTREYLERRRELYQEMMNDVNLSAQQRIDAERMVSETLQEIRDAELEYEQATYERQKEIISQKIALVMDYANAVGSLMSSLADYYEADIKAQVEAGKMSEAEAERQFENVKAMRVAEAVISTITGSLGAYMQASTAYPAPYGQILGAITAAAVLATGAAQIAQIQSTSLSSANSSQVGGNLVQTTPSIPEYQPNYVQNATGMSEIDNLRNSLTDTPIYVRVTDIDKAQSGVRVRTNETSF